MRVLIVWGRPGKTRVAHDQNFRSSVDSRLVRCSQVPGAALLLVYANALVGSQDSPVFQ
jgi:hypothetical protein